MKTSDEMVLHIDGQSVRRDGELWCMTDLWRAASSPKSKRPGEWLRYEGASFVEFLRASLDMGHAPITKTSRKAGGGGDTWGHWQLALAYAQWLSPEFHARVNEVYRAFAAGQLIPAGQSAAEQELIRYHLRVKALERGEHESDWTLEMKMELARLRRLSWTGAGPEPQPMAYAYGMTWRIILGDAVYAALRARNPHPRDGSLHGQWLQEQRAKIAKREDLVIALVLARRSSRWSEYAAEMRAHFRREPVQLRLISSGNAPKRLAR